MRESRPSVREALRTEGQIIGAAVLGVFVILQRLGRALRDSWRRFS